MRGESGRGRGGAGFRLGYLERCFLQLARSLVELLLLLLLGM